MSPIQFGCPFCGALAEVDAHLAGKEALCPSCGGLLVVPTQQDETSPPRETAPMPIEIVARPDDDRVSLRKLWGRASSQAKSDPATPTAKQQPPASDVGKAPQKAPTTNGDANAIKPPREIIDREKDRQKTVSNMVMLFAGIVVLVITLAVLLSLSR